MAVIDGHEHDGVRRYEIVFRSAGQGAGTISFYSDAVTEDGAWAHFRRNIKDTFGTPFLRPIGPDEWLGQP